jgi:predicted dehydrogenase
MSTAQAPERRAAVAERSTGPFQGEHGAVQRKIAIAGLGAAARQIHLPAIARLSDLKIVGAIDPAASAAAFPFPLFRTLDELLDRMAPEIVVVATPPGSHFELTRQALLAGCHVFCEKPFMATLEEAAEIAALSRERERWVVVNNQYRFMNMHVAAKRQIGTPEFGDLLFVRMEQTFFRTPQTEAGWRGQDVQRTCKDFGTHVFDLCRFFFGEDPLAITARMPRGADPQGPDYLNLIELEFSRDRVAHITLDRLCRGPTRYLITHLDGSAGYVEAYLGGHCELAVGIKGGSRRPYLNLDLSPGGRALLYHGHDCRRIARDPLDLFAHATSRLLRAFLDALDQQTTPPCHADDNRRTLALVVAAYDSAAKRTTLEMNY